MRPKVHWRETGRYRYCGFTKVHDGKHGRGCVWESLCGRHRITRLGTGPSLKDIPGPLLCAICDGKEQEL